MKKSIVNMMKYMDEEDLKNIEVSEEDIMKLTKDMDVKAIKDRAMEGIHMERNILKSTRKKTGFRKGIAVFAAAMTISGAVFAAEYFDNFKFFYGGKANVATEDKDAVDKAVTASGIRMTINESVVSDKGAIIMMAFEKEDGSALPKEAVVQTLDIKENKNLGYMINQKVSEDGKKLIANFEIDSSEKLEGKKITVTADEMVNSQTEDSIAKGPWEISFNISSKAKAVEKNLDLAVGNGDQKLQLNKINVSTLGISFDGIKANGDIDKLPEYAPIVKITTVDGKVIELKQGSANEINHGFRLMYDLDTELNRTFIDLSNITNITVDDNVINVK